MGDRRRSGTGCLYEKAGSLLRTLAHIRWPAAAPEGGAGEDPGRARTASLVPRPSGEFRRMQDAEERDPRPQHGVPLPTIDELATSLRAQQELRGLSKSYRENCERMQRVHIAPRMGQRPVLDVSTQDVEAFARALLKRGLLAQRPSETRSSFVHSMFRARD